MNHFQIELSREKSVETGIHDFFTVLEKKEQCSECEDMVDGYGGKTIETLPTILVVSLKRFGEAGEALSSKQEAPRSLDLTDHLSDEIDIPAKYELLAMVSCQGKSLAESEYSAVVLKDRKWIHMTSTETKEVGAEKVSSGFDPQILFYRV
jgi:ubiquitin C-terminal hydrolase